MWPILVSHPKRVFFFSLWESLFCHHIEYWPKLVAGSVVCPACWLGEFLRSFSWCQTSLLQRRHWGIARCTWHSCSKKDVGTSWKYWHMHKNLLWEGRPRETSHRLVSHTPGEMAWLLLTSQWDRFTSEPFPPCRAGSCSFLMLQIPLWITVRWLGGKALWEKKSSEQLFQV